MSQYNRGENFLVTAIYICHIATKRKRVICISSRRYLHQKVLLYNICSTNTMCCQAVSKLNSKWVSLPLCELEIQEMLCTVPVLLSIRRSSQSTHTREDTNTSSYKNEESSRCTFAWQRKFKSCTVRGTVSFSVAFFPQQPKQTKRMN